ncbi:MAG TPA: indole-3-glycerol phosphate synthase TrpC [Solirubrobacteraceae bacterium]|nr:indole-3-glycerol phosphate synthase TrpC [Solirubrobacteraceae bacterium]
MTALDGIVAQTREAVAERRGRRPLPEVTPSGDGARLRAALAAPGVGVIAEFKRRSPSAGVLAAAPDLLAVVGAYERGGAVALSILTEEANFAGNLDDLRAARAASALPLLRKDFVVDEYQLRESVDVGADAVLLIVAALDQEDLVRLHDRATELALDALVEVHDAEELRRALDAGARLIGVNNRDLRDLSVDVTRTQSLMPLVPDGVTVVSESGISTAEQVRVLAAAGVDGVLVGESLMRSGDPADAVRVLSAGSGI